jgi:hypothetical protein
MAEMGKPAYGTEGAVPDPTYGGAVVGGAQPAGPAVPVADEHREEERGIAGPMIAVSLASALLGAVLALGILSWINGGLEYAPAGAGVAADRERPSGAQNSGRADENDGASASEPERARPEPTEGPRRTAEPTATRRPTSTPRSR